MRARMLSLLKIHEGEGSKVLWFTLIGGLLQAGVAIGVSAADSLFLIHLGAAKLPYVYCIMPVLMAVVVPFYSYLLERHGVDKLVDTTLFALVLGGVALYCSLTVFGLIEQGPGGDWVYYIIQMYASLWQIIVFTVLWTCIEEYFDILSAKRLFPVLGGGAALGAILGGGLVAGLTAYIGVPGLFLLWAGLALATYPAMYHVRRAYYKIEETEAEEVLSLSEQMQNIATAVKSSPYVAYLNLGVLLLMFLTTICEYQYYGIFEKQGDEQALAALFGRLYMAVNFFNLIICFFVFSRLISLIGVRNTALIQPVSYMLIFGYFMLNLNFGAAILGFFVCNGIQDVIEDNNWNFLLNPVPPQVNKSVRAFAEGFIDPLGASLAGLFLLVFASSSGGLKVVNFSLSAFHISAIAVAGAVMYLVVVLLLRHNYLGSMVTNLRREWLDFSRSEVDVLTGLEVQEQRQLIERAAQDTADTVTAIRVLWLNDRATAIQSVLAILTRASEEEQAKFCPVLADMLQAQDDTIVRQVLDWLEREQVQLSPRLIEELGRHSLVAPQRWSHWLHSSAAQERAAVTVSLGHSWSLENTLQALESIIELFRGSEEERILAIRALGSLRQERYAHFLMRYLHDPARVIRQEAVIAINRLVNHESGRLLPPLLDAVEGGDAESRIIAMEALAKIGDSDCVSALLSMAATFVPFERRKAEQLILSIGLRSIPATVAVLRNPSYSYEARSIAARAIAKLAFPQLRALVPEIIGQEIERAYQYLYYHSVLAEASQASPGMWVLSCFYMDAQLVILEFVLQILALGGRLPDYEMISSSLRSKNLKARANAVEALEQACNRAMFVRLLPLVDSRPLEAKIQFYRRSQATEHITPQAIVEKASTSHLPLECSSAVQAMWDTAIPDVLDTLRRQLHDMPSGLFRDTVISLLTRTNKEIGSNTIETISHLSRTSFFASFSTLDLVTIAPGVTETSFTAGQPVYRSGDAADALYVIKQGTVNLDRDSIICARGVGETFGEDAMCGATVRTENAVAQSLSTYVLEREYLMQCARAHPRIALGILEKQVLS